MLEITDLRTRLIGPISVSAAAGECVAVQGPSGSGKSLFLRAIVDLDPNEGVVRLDGVDRASMPADQWRQRVTLVPAESGWWTDRVSDHFDCRCDPQPMLQALGVPEALGWQVDRLSSGERHRVAIVRALCQKPDAILLDEPTAMLDQAATARLESLIKDECARGAAVLLVTHDPAQAERLAARRFVMNSGKLKSDSAVGR